MRSSVSRSQSPAVMRDQRGDLLVCDVRSSSCTPASSRIPSRKPIPSAMLALDLLPMVEGLLQFLAIDLDPFAAQQHQAFGAASSCSRSCFGERLAVEGQVDLEIQQRVQAERARLLAANPHLHLRPRRAARRPPVGHADHDARLFDPRRLR